MNITKDEALEKVRYDPDTGVFRHLPRPGNARLVKTWNTRFAGQVVRGTKNVAGYMSIYIGSTRILAHRLAWLIMTGEQPKHEVDHINGDIADNRFVNLRQATRQQNARNTKVRSHSVSQLKGAQWNAKSRKWQARITIGGRPKSLGYFKTAEEAHAAYRLAASERYGEFARFA